MKSRLFYLVTILALCMYSLTLSAATYHVICCVGSVQVKADAKSQWVVAKLDAMVKTGSTIRIGNKGYCCLLSDSGTPVEFRQQGDSVLSDGKAQQAGGPNGSAIRDVSKYLMTALKDNNPKHRYVGSVYRARDMQSSIVFPSDTRLLDDEVLLMWHKVAGASMYYLYVRDAARKDVLKEAVPDTTFRLKLTDLANVKRGDCVYWTASSQSEKSQKMFSLCWVSKSEADSIRAADRAFRVTERGELLPDRSPIACMYIGSWYEKRGFFAEALKFYEQAEILQPEVKEFRNAKSSLLARLGM